MKHTIAGVDLAKEVIQICIYIHKKSQIVKRPAKTKKEAWVQGLVERKGKKCAAVALANKTVRTAYAILTQGTEYQAEVLTA